MTIKLINKGGGGSLPRLSPDLNFPASRVGGTSTIASVTINPQGALTPALNLTGKFLISHLEFNALTAEVVTVRLTIDGVLIWDDTFTSGTSMTLIGDNLISESIQCNTSLLLELQTTTDTSVNLIYLVRPIL